MEQMLTVGFGDLVPTRPASKAFTILFILASILLATAALAHLVGTLVDRQEEVVLAHLFARRGGGGDGDGDGGDGGGGSGGGGGGGGGDGDGGGSGESLPPPIPTAATDAAEAAADRARIGMHASMAAITLAAGTVGFAALDGLPPLDALYLATTGASTVGYGDATPTTDRGRAFAVIWLLVAEVTLARAVAAAAAARGRAKVRRAVGRLLAAPFGVADLAAADLIGDGRVSWAEYLYMMLLRTKRVSRVELDALRASFDARDVSGSGTIDYADCVGV
ncbi:hypothetical protein MMPV_007965 [Pyropia vietnamensis]